MRVNIANATTDTVVTTALQLQKIRGETINEEILLTREKIKEGIF